MSSYPLNPNLKPFWNWRLDKASKLVYDYFRVRTLYGGRSSSKTHEYASAGVKIASEHKTRFLCVRRFQNKIKESVYTVVKNKIDHLGLSGFDVQASSIYHNNGSEFVFYGIERNIDEIKSFEGADILWIEEAHNLTSDQWDILEPTIRKEGSEIWISFNPKYTNDFIYQNFVIHPPEGSIVRLINYDENGYISNTMMKVINDLKSKDYDKYLHVYKGQPLSDEEQVIIKRSFIEAALDFHLETDLELGGKNTVGYDVADSGDDLNATVSANGSIAIKCDEWKGGEDELRKSAKRVKLTASKNDARIIYDSIGVGAGTGSTLKDLSYYDYAPFNAGGKIVKPNRKYEGIKQKEYFSNLKAQAWWLVADRLRNTYDYRVNGNKNYKADELISISSDIKGLESLISELATPYKDFDKAGRVKVESKEDLKKRGIKSPNKADAFIMALSISLVRQSKVTELNIIGF